VIRNGDQHEDLTAEALPKEERLVTGWSQRSSIGCRYGRKQLRLQYEDARQYTSEEKVRKNRTPKETKRDDHKGVGTGRFPSQREGI
jgi:hypothetical protein